MISIVSPIYRAEKILPKLVEEISTVMRKLNTDYEIILVDDRSPDNSWQVMKNLAEDNSNLKIYRLSRNFGQHPTIMAGLSKSIGEWVVVMDCDLQDQPKEIEKLYKKALEGYEVVQASRVQRKDGRLKKLSSRMFYKIFNYLAGIKINNEVANFGIYHKKVINQVLNVNDYIKFFPLFINWVGYRATTVAVEHQERSEGESSYSLGKLISLAFNVIVSFSDKPLKLFVSLGAIISATSFLGGAWVFIKTLMGRISEPGYSSLILSIWFLFGVTFMCLGVLGIYLGKTFNQTKNRPVYIIDEE
ncbi:dolichol-phosphate mannosyltransferase [Chryseobacterium piscicola]|uniref:Dolichol-phosphate mannosyltransferase n=1 Tax=Chryseobacterium piscicola TaxID=551459 RepID=A0A1N7KE24_9FLAO|nr:glycosyltransferase family 2 protein [Chryseobacterium piscicola]PQA96352.1 glycosyltransferase [Chryseobacterium piscicola]SIS59838.1 dolichol-phosphate mannosyltransferase [Chryseobacterium piscicola]